MKVINEVGHFKINTDVSLKEIQDFAISQHTKKISVKILIGLFGFMGILGIIILLVKQDPIAIQGLIMPTLFFIILPYFIKKNAKNIYEGNKEQFKNTEYSFTEEQVILKTKGVDSKMEWSSFYKIEEDKEIVFLFPNKSVAYLLPKRNFNSNNEVKEFMQFAKNKIG